MDWKFDQVMHCVLFCVLIESNLESCSDWIVDIKLYLVNVNLQTAVCVYCLCLFRIIIRKSAI